MACKNCGCNDTHVSLPATYQLGTSACPGGERCEDYIASECVLYNGDDLVDFPLEHNERVEVTLKKLILLHLDPNALTGSNGIHAPYNVETFSIKATEAEIEWDAVPNVTGYEVSIRQGALGSWTNVNVSSSAKTYKFINLTASTHYHVKVTAKGINNSSYSSLIISFETTA
jgi:hypothetical protein